MVTWLVSHMELKMPLRGVTSLKWMHESAGRKLGGKARPCLSGRIFTQALTPQIFPTAALQDQQHRGSAAVCFVAGLEAKTHV